MLSSFPQFQQRKALLLLHSFKNMAPSKRKAEDDSVSSKSKKPATVKKDEEEVFPRGGGSVLTPLEHKQITIEAKRDALFEEESGGKPSKKDDKESKKRKRKSKEKDAAKPVRDEDAVRIEGLNYKVWRMYSMRS